MTAKPLSATAAVVGILLHAYPGSSATTSSQPIREGPPWQSFEEKTLGLEGQNHSERMRCMRNKQPQPHGLLESHLGKMFPGELRVDDLVSRGPLKGAECTHEHGVNNGCGILTLKPQPQDGKPCVREVPKLIHFVWLDHALPKKYAANIAQVMEVNPDWPVMLWVNEAAKDVTTLTNILGSKRFSPGPEAATKRLHLKSIDAYKPRFRNWDIIQNQSNVGARSDWIRLEVVYWYGGVYMDTDVHPRHGFSEYGGVFRWPFVSYSSPEGYGNLCNCVWSAEKQSPFLKMNFEGWREAHFNFNRPSGVPHGCGVMTAAFITYNHPEIIMLGQEYMFMLKNGVEPVMTMSFDGSWIEKGMWGRESGLIVDDKNEIAEKELAPPARAVARPALPATQPHDGHHTLIILLRTGAKTSATRRESIKKTWASGLADNQLKIMGANEGCRQKWGDNHERGLTCLEANAHTEIMNRTDFSWLLVVDDDTYVVIDRLTNLLDTLDPRRLHAFGVPGCGNCGGGRKGFCGGGGYFLSRQSLLHMAGMSDVSGGRVLASVSQAFVSHFMEEPDNIWCDVRFACVAQDKGLRLVDVKGMYGNHIEDGKSLSQIIRLKKEDPPALVFHLVRNASYMERIHRMVVEMAAQRPNSMKKFVEPRWPKDTPTSRAIYDPANCPHAPHNTKTCWADSVYQQCPVDRQGAYDAVMAMRKGGNKAMHAAYSALLRSKVGCTVPDRAPTLVDKEEDEEGNPFADEVGDQESAIYEALYKKKAASTGDELGASVVAGLLKESGADTRVLREAWNTAKNAPDVPHGAKSKMNFKEFVVACKLTVKAGGTFAASSGAY